jgi:hypothetical protein
MTDISNATGPWVLKSSNKSFKAQQIRALRKTEGYTSSNNNSNETE